jgi:hypothetical protein
MSQIVGSSFSLTAGETALNKVADGKHADVAQQILYGAADPVFLKQSKSDST